MTETASPFWAGTNLWSNSAPCLSGEQGQPTQTIPVRLWKQIIADITHLYTASQLPSPTSLFSFPVQLRQSYKNLKNGLIGPFDSWEEDDTHKMTTNLRAVSSPFLSSVSPPPPVFPKITFGMLEGTSLPAAWRISYTTCSRIFLPTIHLIFSSSPTISR